jgi:hypothetical protein
MTVAFPFMLFAMTEVMHVAHAVAIFRESEISTERTDNTDGEEEIKTTSEMKTTREVLMYTARKFYNISNGSSEVLASVFDTKHCIKYTEDFVCVIIITINPLSVEQCISS